MGNNQKKSHISYFSANITSIISVALVLLLLGLVALIGIAGRNLTNKIKENIGFDVVIKENATVEDINVLKQLWNRAPYVSSVKYISKEEGLREWEKETGEDLVEMLGVNPLNAEFEVRMKSNYASVDSMNVIERGLRNNPAIESIQMHRDMISSVEHNINQIAIVLSVVALILMIISFALINNTIRLSVYSKRFIIHTMKLVGAKPGFIRRPFIVSNILNGVIASFIAMAILSGIMYYGISMNEDLGLLLSPESVWCVYGGIVALGIVLCAMASSLAANKFIRLSYDDLFKK